jgi:hypothetical protein
MAKTEYKVVVAPERAPKKRGLKGAALFADAVEGLMNELAADGWRYVRADTLPQEERSGLTSKTTTYRNLLIFQRDVAEEVATTAPVAEAAKAEAPKPAPASARDPEPDEEIENLWQSTDRDDHDLDDEGDAKDVPVTPALFPNRQR